MFRTTCKSCGMPILWVKTRSGKAMPCDIKPIRFRIDDSARRKEDTSGLAEYVGHFLDAMYFEEE